MTNVAECPLVSLVVIAYRQERLVGDAIAGAFAQTHRPLEIILSDDHSPDRTFEVMRDMAAAYSGPHRVILNRTASNLGLVPHIDRVMELVSGELVVVNAGDDISSPDRVARIAELWHRADRGVTLIHSAACGIDADGRVLDVIRPPQRIMDTPTPATIIRDKSHVIGATAAWDRAVFREFGPLGPGLSTEDRVIPFRAALLGRIAYLDEPLVHHRVGGISSQVGSETVQGYLYGITHRLRKWTLEIDRHILDRFADRPYPEKACIEQTCRERIPGLQLHVDLAEASYIQRFVMAPRAVRVALHDRSLMPVKHWLRYLFDRVYIPYATGKIARRAARARRGAGGPSGGG